MNRLSAGLISLTLTMATLCDAAMADGDRASGALLADRLCSRCHSIASGPSPVADAPAFSGLARKWPIEFLAEAFAEGLVTGHRSGVEMPEFVLTPEEIDDLLAYLESVQE